MSINPTAQQNGNLYFVPIRGEWDFQDLPFKASVAMPQGAAIGIEIVTNDVTGNVTLMGVENVTGADVQGILMQTIASTDADYATAGKKRTVAIPKDASAIAEFAVGAGTFTAADVFKTVEFNSDSLGLAVDTKGKGARITKYISSSRGECQFVLPTTETA